MLKRYSIWDKKASIITPSGAVFTAEEWMEQYPVAKLENIIVICSAGEINGGFFGTLGQMKQIYEANGVDFSSCETPEQCLEAIETYEDEMNKPNTEPTTEERIAAALEFQNLMSM